MRSVPFSTRHIRSVCLLLCLGACAGQNLPGIGRGDTTGSTLQIAQATEKSGDYAGAAKLYERVLSADPNNTAALLGAGESYAALGQTLRAESALMRGLQLQPNNILMLNQLGRIKFVEHDGPSAVAYFDKALSVDQRNVSALTGKAVALDYQSQHTAAQRVYQQALRLYPTNFILLSNYALSLASSGQQEKGIAILQDLIRDPNAAPHVRGNLALVYGLAGRDEDARATLKTDMSAAKIEENIGVYRALRHLMLEGKPIGALVFG
ncbi:MAG: tetratricopeptide repeat protein [Rhodobacteraceae bacterium]|nr:tetratricopeptide repeat protein [Paracoccaceae bacterium]